jgi:hypothetical protein
MLSVATGLAGGSGGGSGGGCPEGDWACSLAAIKRKQGIILFTHIRRAGGTVLEEYVLKPFVKSQGKGRKDYLCREGELGRFYLMARAERKAFAADLGTSALQWRHCPFGLHELLPPAVPHVYITMLRDPFDRMLSWYDV